MFLNNNNLQALIIDLNSFDESEDDKWIGISSRIQCVFIVNDEVRDNKMKHWIGQHTYKSEKRNVFLGQKGMLKLIVNRLGIPSLDIAYVSNDIDSIREIIEEPVGTIYIQSDSGDAKFPYRITGFLPDYCLHRIEGLSSVIEHGCQGGYISEIVSVYGTASNYYKRGLLTFFLEPDLPIFIGGRYYKKSHSYNNIHPLSNRIVRSKNDISQDIMFSSIYKTMVEAVHMQIQKVDAITRVPPKPSNARDRLKPIVAKVSRQIGVLDMSENFSCLQDYTSQKSLNESQRIANVKGKFSATSEFNNKHVVLLDDVLSTGATIRECGRTLYAAGAKKVTVVVLAANQFGNGPDSSMKIPCLDEECEGELILRINRSHNNVFYGCSKYGDGCTKAQEFISGWIYVNEDNSIMPE